MENEAVKELTKQRDALLDFVQEYIEAWNDGMTEWLEIAICC